MNLSEKNKLSFDDSWIVEWVREQAGGMFVHMIRDSKNATTHVRQLP
jgi:hypothetical protein